MARDSDITARTPTPAGAAPGLNGPPAAPDPKVKPMEKDKPKGKDKSKPEEPRDSLREIAETVVFVVVLVLMLKTFVAEAFVIPTGSMAETLFGYQKMVTCEQCGHVFPVNCSSEVDPSNGVFRDVTGCHCPNCQFHMNWGTKQNGPSWGSGDRVLVAKFLYDDNHLWAPKRGQVFVFKYPENPQKANTAMNYIKRCMGEPGETLAIFGGDVYVTKKLAYPKPDCKPEDLWRGENMYRNDQAALDLFKDSLKRREAGQSLPGDFDIYRKPPGTSLAVRRIVFDNDHQPLDLKGKPEFRRWKDEGNARWAGDDPDMPKSFAHAGIAGQTAEAWLTYGHRLRPTHQPGPDQRHPPPQQPPGFDNDLRKLIANEMGYNSGQGDFNQDVTGEFWVGDLMLDCSVEVTQADGEFVLDLAKGPDRFQARFDVATGNCKLVRLTGTGQAEAPVLAENETKLKGTGTYHVRFANFDERLTVWVDGRLPFGDGVAYAPAKERGPVGPNDLQPARVGAVRAGVKVSHLQLWRDSYYTTTEVGTRVALNGDKDEPILTMYVQPGHFLALGDNSAASADSRSWGLVPQRLLLGRALVVYYPFWPFVSQTRAGLIR